MKFGQFLKMQWLCILSFCLLGFTQMGRAGSLPGAEFGMRLFRSVVQAKAKENLVLSPYAIRVALGMMALGAHGNTLRQLGKPPELWTQKKDSSYKLLLANRLWVNSKTPLLPNFLDLSEKTFGVRPWMVDFSKAPDFIAERMNGWVEERTAGRINEVISVDEINPDTSCFLSSAIYFKGSWMSPFRHSETQVGAFQASQVDYLHKLGSFMVDQGPEYQVVDIPYSDGEVALMVILPLSPDGLSGLERHLSQDTWNEFSSHLSLKTVDLMLPKFALSSKLELVEILKGLGIIDPFDPEKANFSGMTGKKNLYLSKMTHQTTLALSEEGTEADVASGSAVSVPASPEHAESKAFAGDRTLASVAVEPAAPIQFHADHPFIFVIHHRVTHAQLLVGHVLQPPAHVATDSAQLQ
jgi:serpin B